MQVDRIRYFPSLYEYDGDVTIVKDGKEYMKYHNIAEFMLSDHCGERKIKTIVIVPSDKGLLSIYINLEN